MRKEDEIEDSTKRLEMIVRGMVKKQALDIIKKEKITKYPNIKDKFNY